MPWRVPPDDYVFVVALMARESERFFCSAYYRPTASKAPACARGSQTQLPHFDGFNSRKAAEFCGPSRWRSICGAKNRSPSDGFFYLDRLGLGVLAFKMEEAISLLWTSKIKVVPRFSISDLSKLPLPPPQGVVPKKPKTLI
jgi:hypothetical protein